MQNSQPANPTVAKLLEADAQLAAQEIELSAQLKSIGEKRHSLKTVIDMFAPEHTADTTPVAIPAQPLEVVAIQQVESTTPERSLVDQDITSPELNSANADTTEAPALQPQKQQAKKNSSATSNKQTKKSAPAKKPSKAPDTWQQYVKDEFYGATLSEAVAQVMQEHSEQVLEIAAIIDAIFTSNIPKEVRSTARERVSNVLSVGAKSGKWYRGQLGKYSMSKAAVEG
ncbi:hypothetical protein [Aliterella atlantica]|uniref:Uncharacterized protein n=1 Tax=Aliterella atlantica CENA595 TaxID=1618023 RepID=A0A0D8ZLA1_9CYAN|nr:hypothetical protein [Aliterella atlantica]KJH69515.1 hypothetical protein UH38_23455 [Aliterella atlantica CENA595]